MNDIVERLRMGLATPIEMEAANEIERLTAAHDHQYAVAGTLLREAERANREIERLRGLLSDEVRPLLAAVAETQLWADRVSDKIQKAIEDE
jgi:hypothetical protein